MKKAKKAMKILLFLTLLATQYKCAPSEDTLRPSINQPVAPSDVRFWLTKSDQSNLLQKQNVILNFGTIANAYPNIDVDASQNYQTVDGFGFTLTGGSAQVINQLSATRKQALLQELFGNTESAIGINYLRISIGASDLNEAPFTYDDVAIGATDLSLDNFSLAPDSTNLIPLLKQILLINPNLKILGSPWSPPVWMKSNSSFVGGTLQLQYYHVYAQYFVKYIQKMQQEGIPIDAITIQNEPLNPYNNPSLSMSAAQQTTFIKNNLGPVFQAAGLTTKIIVYDHNCDHPEYPIGILNDAVANPFVDGSAFHLYAGDISALSTVHNAFPAKNLYFTEQYTASTGSFEGDLKWHVKNVIIGSMRNWSKNALEWNLASNAAFEPHTPGGCNTCKGALTIGAGDVVTRNVGYYIVGHASKFVPTGSVRIASNTIGALNTVAFKTPTNGKVLIVENDATTATSFNIKFNGKWTATSLDAGAVGTYTW